jgi:hypothetical protein
MNGPKAWWSSKKLGLSTAAGLAVVVCTWLAAHDPDPNRQKIYMIGGGIFGLIAGNHVQAEAKIDAAAVKKSAPEAVGTMNVNAGDAVDMENAG